MDSDSGQPSAPTRSGRLARLARLEAENDHLRVLLEEQQALNSSLRAALTAVQAAAQYAQDMLGVTDTQI